MTKLDELSRTADLVYRSGAYSNDMLSIPIRDQS